MTPITLILYSMCLLIVSGSGSLWLRRNAPTANFIGAAGAVLAAVAGLAALGLGLTQRQGLSLSLPWAVPYGRFSVAIDPLSAVFLLPIFILSGLAALYGREYLRHYEGKKNLGSVWFFYQLLLASMILVVVARQAVLFLLAWEMMSISSFFLVLFEGEKEETARAGLVYLIATHVGTLFLLAMFVLLGNSYGALDFAQWKTPVPGLPASAIFLLAIVGFGTKAGFMPLHIWLPEAHPAAPSHVSAVMSGVMIKTGIYGLLRIITFLGLPPVWWGYMLIAIGIFSGILGVLFALAQHDLKRLLAYHSIENIGIISMGIGLGVLGMNSQNPVLAVMGFGGGLWHVVNHAFFKGLLFLGAGAVIRETGTREIDVLGGLLKKMPMTGIYFLVGATAICGLPPLNGFFSEFLIYFGAFQSILGSATTAFASLAVIASLALIGGLAAACFTKAFGIIFLGEARRPFALKAREPGLLMRVPMLILAAACVMMGLCAPVILHSLERVLTDLSGLDPHLIAGVVAQVSQPLFSIVSVFLLFGLLVILVAVFRSACFKGKPRERAGTWDCGYARPQPRMQYTASSYAQPIVDFFKDILRTQKLSPGIREYFPSQASFTTHTADMFQESVFRPLMQWTRQWAEKLTWFQHGKLQVYILYIWLALAALLIWKL